MSDLPESREEGERVPVELTAAEIKNVLAAYDRLNEGSPFFSFNQPTRIIIERFRAALASMQGKEG